MSRKCMSEDQVQGICTQCNKNKQTPAPKSKLGYKRYLELCSSCSKRKYGLGVSSTNRFYSKYKDQQCAECGFVAVNSCQLDIHHKDHNHTNNDLSNLITLCANCHRLKHC